MPPVQRSSRSGVSRTEAAALFELLQGPLKEIQDSIDNLRVDISRTYVRQDVYTETQKAEQIYKIALEARVAKIEKTLTWVASTVGVSIIGAVMALILKGAGQ